MRYLLRVILLAGAASLTFYSGCAKPPAASQVNPLSRIEALPPADPQKVARVRNMKDWRNPYLIVRVDGVALLDPSNNEQRILKPDQLVGALAQLPASAWPYGRVVAVAQNAVFGSDADKAQLRRNRALVAGTLESLQVLINWVPSA
jgi:hypothetical protein